MSSRRNHQAVYLIVLLVFLIDMPVNSVQIRVENKGAFVARVLVRYQNSKGEEQSVNSGSFSSLQSSTLNIEDNIKSIDIEVQMYTFINSLRTIFQTNNPCPHTRCFVVWGTVFKAIWSENCCR